MSSNNQPFYVGQKVVCVKNHSEHVIKEGEVFNITGIEERCCRWVVTIGVKSILPYSECANCGRLYPSQKERFFSEYLFAPINPYQSDVTKELAEKALSVGDSVDQPVKKLVNN